MCPDILDDGRSAGSEALARNVIGRDRIRAKGQARGLEARLPMAKNGRTQDGRAVQEGDGTGGNRARVFEILDRGGQGDRPPEVRRPRLRCEGGSRWCSWSSRKAWVDVHCHGVPVLLGSKSAVPA